MKLVRYFLACSVVCLAATSSANAAELVGSFQLGNAGNVTVSPDQTDLSTATTITLAGAEAGQDGIDDYAPIVQDTAFSGFTLDLTQAANGFGGFSTTATGFGTFTATSGVLLSQNTNFIDLYVLGTFTPEAGGALDGFDPSATSARISVNLTGEIVGVTLTFTSPPLAIPEPSSVVLAGLGVVGLGLFRVVRHRASK